MRVLVFNRASESSNRCEYAYILHPVFPCVSGLPCCTGGTCMYDYIYGKWKDGGFDRERRDHNGRLRAMPEGRRRGPGKVHVSTIHSSEERIKVFVRVRPLIIGAHGGRRRSSGDRCNLTPRPSRFVGHGRVGVLVRWGLPAGTTQKEVFAQVRDCERIEGFNATCFAYGQTGSGKTYTMFEDDTRGDMYSVPPHTRARVFS